MFRKILAITALAALAALGAAQSKTLVINRILVNAPNGSDDGQGLELFEIKNTSDTTSVDLTNVGLVIIENEHGQKGELDGYYKFSGTLAAGQTLCIRDKAGSSNGPALPTPNGVSNGTSANYEFFSTPNSLNSTGTDLSNSGANYILVDGLDASKFSGFTFGSTQLDTNGDKIFDFTATASTADDLWTSAIDAVAIYPDGTSYPAGFDNYISHLGLSAEHSIAAVATPGDDWTPDYLQRMYRVSGTTKVYDRFLEADILSISGTYPLKMDLGGQMMWDDGTAVSATDFKTSAGVSLAAGFLVYVGEHFGGNFTSDSTYDYVVKGSFLYRH